MRNRFSGTCYRCRKTVKVGAGHFERFYGSWRVQHAECAIKFRALADETTPNERTKARADRRRKAKARMQELNP